MDQGFGDFREYATNEGYNSDLIDALERVRTKTKDLYDKNPPTEDSFYSSFPEEQRGSAQTATPMIAKALEDEGIYSPEAMAYALATVEHETSGGNSTFQSPREGYFVDEAQGLEPGTTGKSEARKRGYSGGENYYGRGYTQITHDYNYKEIGERIGMGDELVKNPDLALEPETAAKIMAAFFKDKGVSDYIQENREFEGARKFINPDDKGPQIAKQAKQYFANMQGKQNEILPGDQSINQKYGNYNPKVEKYSGGINRGVDVSAKEGDKVAAPGGGRWKAVEVYAGGGMNQGWGNSVMLQNMKTGEKLRFSHLGDVKVEPGQEIEQGDVFGTIGTTGNITGPHGDIEYYDATGRLQDFMKSIYRRYL